MRELGEKIVAIALLAGLMPAIGSSYREALLASEGQQLVERFFDGGEFNTGDWGNDISLLLPFKWNLGVNGQFTLFSMAEHVRTREAHWPTYQIVDGRLLYRTHEWVQQRSVDFWPSELYELHFSDGRTMLAYHNEQTARVRHPSGDAIRIFTSSVWYELEMGTNGIPLKIVHKGWPEGLFADNTLKVIRSVVPLRFRGPMAEPVASTDRVHVRLNEYTATKSLWQMDGEKMKALSELHRKYVVNTGLSNIDVIVYFVACDVNHDGICDAYVSSEAERADAGKYRWSLYLGDGHGFSRQKAPVKFSASRVEDIYFETDVVAHKDDFFRIDRVNMPAYVMVLDELENRPESWSYIHHDNFVRKFRKGDGLSKADYYACLENSPVPNISGISSIRDMFFFSHYGLALVNVERLECREVEVK